MKFIVKKSNIQGKGCFAQKSIKKGDTICIFEGKKISIPELKKKYESKKIRLDDPLQIQNSKYLILEKPFIYFNHSCVPNATLKDGPNLIAIREIKEGQEITYDYSSTEWSDPDSWGVNWQKDWKMLCKCNKSNCRKEIGEFATLPKEIQEFYIKNNLVQNFITEKFNSLLNQTSSKS